MAAKYEVTALVKERIKLQQSLEKFKPGVTPLQWDDDTFPQKVLSIIGSLHDETSREYFVAQVAIMCGGTPEQYNLKSLKKEYAEAAFKAFHEQWKKLSIGRQRECEDYIAYKKTYGPALKKHVATHEDVVQSLFSTWHTKPKDGTIPKLLALSYWLHHFYERKRLKGHKDYNKHLHYFIKDFIITFLSLRCQPPVLDEPRAFDEAYVFHEFLLCKHITPENDVYLLLVLKRMLQILLIDPPSELEPIKFATKVHERMSCFQGWGREGANGVLKVVKDQSRYLAITSPALRKNFVSYKTRDQIADTVLRIEKSNITSIEQQAESEMKGHGLKKFKQVLDFMEKLNPGDWFDIKGSVDEREQEVLNLLHHCILLDIAKTILPHQTPKYNARRWFVDEEGKRINIIPFIHSLAARIIEEGRNASDRTTTREHKEKLYTLVVELQRIIATRWYLCDAYHKGKTPDAKEVQSHEEILFTMIAFRALLLLMLPKNPNIRGFQRVAESLPNYAKKLKLDVHLMVFS